MSDILKVSEIFESIDGEGIRTGYPVTFIRLYGCCLSCSFCDSKYSWSGSDYQELSIKEILAITKKYGHHRITLTGGEPLMTDNGWKLLSCLLYEGYEVNVETNGSIRLKNINNSNLIYTMDYKSKFSGMEDRMIPSNIDILKEKDVLKFVVANKEDLDKMKEIIDIYKPKCSIFVSPVFGEIEPKEIVEYVLKHKLDNVRVQVQLHKIIWDPELRGV